MNSPLSLGADDSRQDACTLSKAATDTLGGPNRPLLRLARTNHAGHRLPLSHQPQSDLQRVFYVAGIIGEHCELSVFNYLADMRTEVILEGRQSVETNLLILNGGQRRDRTAAAGLSGPPANGPKCPKISGRN
jgi:hypothetical protein